MIPENEKALIVGCFLSKFDMRAYEAWGFSSRSSAHEKLAAILGVKAATLKNMPINLTHSMVMVMDGTSGS